MELTENTQLYVFHLLHNTPEASSVSSMGATPLDSQLEQFCTLFAALRGCGYQN